MGEGDFPETIGGRYRTIREIGRGAMGVVYEVEHVNTGEHLALKVLHPSTRVDGIAAERFKREARASSRIKSDHVVRVIDADVAPELDGAPFLVMELLEGTDLDRLAEGPLPRAEEVVDWLRQMARALDKAHEIEIIHRDLKPANLFLAARRDGGPEVVKILDFGLAKTVSGDDRVKTRSGQILGTPMYMAPEQADPDGPPESARSDLFSLGLIAFRLLVGHDYWSDGTVRQILTQLLVEPMPPASSRGSTLGAAFDTWFSRACARDPEGRFGSAHEMVEALAVALDLPTVSRAPTSAPRPRAEPAPLDDAAQGSTLAASEPVLSSGTRSSWGLAIAVAVAAAAIAMIAWPRSPGPAASKVEPAPAASPSRVPEPAASPAPSVSVAAAAPSSSASSAPPAPSHAPVAVAPPRPAPAPRPHPSASARPIDPLEGQH